MWTSGTSSTRGGRPPGQSPMGEESCSYSKIPTKTGASMRRVQRASGNVSGLLVTGRPGIADTVVQRYPRVAVIRNDGSSKNISLSGNKTNDDEPATHMFLSYYSDQDTMTMSFDDAPSPSSSPGLESQLKSSKTSEDNTRHSLLHLMGLWERLSTTIQDIPGDPSVVAQAIKVCIGAGAAAHRISKGVRVSVRLAEMRSRGNMPVNTGSVSCDVIAAAILSTSFSTSPVFPSMLVREKVGKRVARLSEDIVQVSKLPSRIDVYDDDAAAAVRDMCLAFYDISATMVEVVSRLVDLESIMERVENIDETDHGTRALHHCVALEALQVYGPLGHALGLKSESLHLENLSLEILFPSSYKKTLDWLNTYVSRHNTILESARQELETAVLSHPEFLHKAESIIVQSRTKSAISTLKKLLRLGNLSQGGRKREEVFDVLGLRAIVVPHGDDEASAIEACYIVENIIETLWPVIQSRSKDYIASPKPNGYSSLHRSVIVADGVLDEVTVVELQIRTAGMHVMAEKGDASHGAYKGGLTASQTQHLQHIQQKKVQQIAADSSTNTDYDAGEGLFRSIDINGDGEVSLSELKAVLEDLGEDGAEALLERFDMNRDGVISIDEFMEFQKVMGLSHAIIQIDHDYAKSLPSLVESQTVLGAYNGDMDAQKISNKGSDEDSGAMHVWRPGSWSSNKRHMRAEAFTEGDESLSSGSLDDGSKTSGEGERSRDEHYIGAKSYSKNVITIQDDARQDESKPHREMSVESNENVQEKAAETRPPLNDAMHGLKRLFSKAGTEEIEATWSIEAIVQTDVSNAASKKISGRKIKLPRHGPAIIGAVRDKDNDLIIDIPTVSGRHARLEVIRDRVNRLSKCIVMDLGSTNGVWVNRSKIVPYKEVLLFPGDVICFAEPSISFKVDTSNEPGLPDKLGPAVLDGLSIAETLEAEAATMGIFAPKVPFGVQVEDVFQELIQRDDYQGAYMLLLGEAMRNPTNGAIWAKLAGIERQRARRNIQNSTLSTTRSFIRAAVERFDLIQDVDLRRKSLARVFSTWAQMEFDVRNDASARILFQKGVRCLQKISNSDIRNKLLAKLLSTWATREWKLKDFVVASRLCSEALEVEPQNPHVLTLSGKINAEAGKYQLARQQFKKAFLTDKSFMPALQAWGKMEASLNQIDTARKLFQAGYIIDATNQYILQAWAHAEGQAGSVEKARELFKQCAAAHPQCRAAWHGWATLEEKHGCYEEAKRLYKKVLELKPKSKRTLCSLGKLERLLGNTDESEKLLRRALQYDGQHVASLQELANTLKIQKQFTEAHALQKKVSRINATYRSQVAGVQRINSRK